VFKGRRSVRSPNRQRCVVVRRRRPDFSTIRKRRTMLGPSSKIQRLQSSSVTRHNQRISAGWQTAEGACLLLLHLLTGPTKNDDTTECTQRQDSRVIFQMSRGKFTLISHNVKSLVGRDDRFASVQCPLKRQPCFQNFNPPSRFHHGWFSTLSRACCRRGSKCT
jgi:hypothetical protein